MAHCTMQIGICIECKKAGPMLFTNGNQSQEYCDICRPIVRQRRIHEAIWLLVESVITGKVFDDFLERKGHKK